MPRGSPRWTRRRSTTVFRDAAGPAPLPRRDGRQGPGAVRGHRRRLRQRRQRVWTEASDGQGPGARLLGLPGIGAMKARPVLAILGKRFGVQPPGWEAVLPTHPTLGDVDSPNRSPPTRPASGPRRPRCAPPRPPRADPDGREAQRALSRGHRIDITTTGRRTHSRAGSRSSSTTSTGASTSAAAQRGADARLDPQPRGRSASDVPPEGAAQADLPATARDRHGRGRAAAHQRVDRRERLAEPGRRGDDRPLAADRGHLRRRGRLTGV